MNRPITRLLALVILMFALLVAFTSRWTVFEAASLRESPLNRRLLLAQERIARGAIVTAGGSVIARSTRNGEGFYERSYPQGSLFSSPIGYSYLDTGQTGLERYRNAALTGKEGTTLQSFLDALQGIERPGNEVVTTLDAHVQQVAARALEGHHGAVVAIEPSTGAVRALYSSPGFDPNDLRTPEGLARIERQPGSPLVDRATQYGFAPGSTFKLVTATAALNTGQFTPSSTLSGRNGIPISGVPLHNDNNESFGQITLTKALALSVDTVWAQVAEQVGKGTLARYMARFGFDSKPQLDLPAEEMSASGEYEEDRLLAPTSERVDVGRMGIGQDKLRVTPLQMAEVVATIANGGRLMVPYLTERIVDPEGRTLQTVKPRVQSVVMKTQTAHEITEMMEAVVNEGTGTPAQIPGVQVAGKTGTAETQFGSAINDAWFVAFAPARDPRVAVAVAVAHVPGYGATFAAPVARAVLEAALG
jgi:peptidoglycan glycosyltransferase